MVLKTIEADRTDFFSAYEWFQNRRLSEPQMVDGQIDQEWLMNTIAGDFNNETIRAYVWGQFLQDFGEEVIK